MQYLLTVPTAYLLGLFAIPLFRKFILGSKLVSSKGIPLIGGLGIAVAFIPVMLLGLRLAGALSKESIGLALSSLMMLVFGVIDDRYELSVLVKFLLQMLAAAMLVFFGVRTQLVNLGYTPNLLITFVWVLGITNAFNLLDVADGVAAGTAIIVSLAFATISLLNADIATAIISLSLAGATLSFSMFNLPPAKIYLGNGGSHFLGFLLSAIALLISYAPLDRKAALFSPLLILGLPIFDTTFLVLMRIIRKNLPFRKSNDHLILKYLALGHSKRKALLAILGLCLFYSLCGIAVSQVSNTFSVVLMILASCVSLIVAVKMSKVTVNG